MGMTGPTPTDRYIHSFVDVARQQLRAHSWEEIEPSLAESWEELREPTTPPWQQVAAEILAKSMLAGGCE